MIKNKTFEYYCFFDVDETVTQNKTLFDFYYFALNKKYGRLIGQIIAFKQNILLKLFSKFGASRETINQLYCHFYKGWNESDLAEIASAWIELKMKNPQHFFRPEILNEITKHKNRNAGIVFVSGSPEILIEQIARHLGAHHVIATKLIVKDGHFTGNNALPTVIGEGKARRIKKFCAEKDFHCLNKCHAYGDHI